MSFLKRMFGGGSFEDLRAEADRLFEEKKFGEAKLTYDRAVSAGKEVPEADLAHCKTRVIESCDAIARSRMKQAEELRKSGELELAREELVGARETAVTPEVAREAELLLEDLERSDARSMASDDLSITDDEHYMGIAGTWEEEQLEEYDTYGEDIRQAILHLHREEFKQAREKLEALAKEHEKGSYLFYELGRARVLDADIEGGKEALRAFLTRIGPDEGGEARLSAHRELARLCDDAGDIEGAVNELQRCIEALDEDPRPYVALGNYLRTKGMPDEAVSVLESALAVIGEQRRDPFVLQELGLALVAAGRDADAMRVLDEVVAYYIARREFNFPAEGTTALARIYEKNGKKERAADLFRSLAKGADRANHELYHREAARLLTELGLTDEALRMSQRADELKMLSNP